jgi:L-fucose isomerase-like protein
MDVKGKRGLCVYVVSSLLGLEVGLRLADSVKNICSARGVEFIGLFTERDLDKVSECEVNVVLVATGGTEHIVVKLAENSKLTYLFYTEEYNSLPATIEALAYLRERGVRIEVKLFNIEVFTSILDILKRSVEAYWRIKNCKFGVIGGISPWLVYSKTPRDILERIIGGVVEIPLSVFYKYIEESTYSEDLLENLLRSARRVEVSREDVIRALRVYSALKRIIEDHGLCGFTIKCFDLVKDLDVTACLALSLLNRDLVVAGCEGDVPLMISMAIGAWSTSKPVFMGNIASVKPDEIILAHCTSYIPLKCPYELHTHFESGRSVGVSVRFPVGSQVTVFRVDSRLEKLRVIIGEILSHEWRNTLCRTQIRIKLKNSEKIIKESIGNHYALVLGDHVEELTTTARLLGMSVENI